MPSIAESLGFAPFTVNETAGMFVGAAIIAAAVNAPKLDAYIARIQRRDLGLCPDCGGLGRKPCGSCRGRGVEGSGPLAALRSGLGIDPFGPMATSSTTVAKSCTKCGGSGQFSCPACNLRK